MRNEATAAYLRMGVAHHEWQARLCIDTEQIIAAIYDPDGGARLWRALRPEIADRVSAVIIRREAGETGMAMANAAAEVLADCNMEEQ